MTLVLVTGTGRSGTSFLMSVLEHGGVPMPPMTAYYCESIDAMNVNAALLRERGLHVWERQYELAEQYGEAIRAIRGPVVKQTEICHTLDVWAAARDDLHVVVCHRRLDQVRKSFTTMYRNGRSDLAYATVPESAGQIPAEAWPAFAFGQLTDVLATIKIPHVSFEFPADLAASSLAFDRMSSILGPLITKAAFEEAVGALADQSQVHWQTDDQRIAHADVPPNDSSDPSDPSDDRAGDQVDDQAVR